MSDWVLSGSVFWNPSSDTTSARPSVLKLGAIQSPSSGAPFIIPDFSCRHSQWCIAQPLITQRKPALQAPAHVNAIETPFIKGTLRSPSKLSCLMYSEHEFPPQHTEQPKRGTWWDGCQVGPADIQEIKLLCVMMWLSLTQVSRGGWGRESGGRAWALQSEGQSSSCSTPSGMKCTWKYAACVSLSFLLYLAGVATTDFRMVVRTTEFSEHFAITLS